MGSLRFSVTMLTGSASAFACAGAGAAAGHRNNDFEITVLPAYQHLRPSIRRQDQCPCALDGTAALHSLTCAAGALIGSSAAMTMARKTD